MYDTKPVEVFEFHHSMLVDSARTDAFLGALMQTIKPGDIVLDIGTGTGVLACFACLAGAKHVYAIEQSPVIGLAREICARNGLQDRVTFINEWSLGCELPQLADVLVTETIGNSGFEEGILRWVQDARARLLKKNARLVPRKLEMFAVPVESAEDYAMVGRWDQAYYTLDFSAVATVAANNLLWIDLLPTMFLSEPACLLSADLHRYTGSDLTAEVSFLIQREGVVHGFGGWFAAELADGITLSNEPPLKTPSWTNTFYPLEYPLAVEAGDRVKFSVRTSDHTARWAWQVIHCPVGRPEEGLPEQATLFGELSSFLTSEDLAPRPARSSRGDIDLFVLQQMDGSLTVADLAQATRKRFPHSFSNSEKVVEYIHRLLARYGREG
jgi:protein arginine N-methyltransferase 1